MEYVEIQRAKRVLFWYGVVLLGICAIVLISIFGAAGGKSHSGNGGENFSSLVGGASFGAMIVATFVASALSAEAATAPIIWTRPRSRDEMAWRYVAIDALTILAGYLMLLAAIIAVAWILGGLPHVRFDAGRAGIEFALGLGVALMWYALVSLVAVRLPARGGLIAGLSWAAVAVLGVLYAAPLPTVLHVLVTALNYLNPLAWMGHVGSSSSSGQIIPFSASVRALGTWLIALAAIAASVRLWSTREA